MKLCFYSDLKGILLRLPASFSIFFAYSSSRLIFSLNMLIKFSISFLFSCISLSYFEEREYFNETLKLKENGLPFSYPPLEMIFFSLDGRKFFDFNSKFLNFILILIIVGIIIIFNFFVYFIIHSCWKKMLLGYKKILDSKIIYLASSFFPFYSYIVFRILSKKEIAGNFGNLLKK